MRFQTWLLGTICIELWGGQFQPLRGLAYEAWWVVLTGWLTIGLLTVLVGAIMRKNQGGRSGIAAPPGVAAEILRRASESRMRQAATEFRPSPPAQG